MMELNRWIRIGALGAAALVTTLPAAQALTVENAGRDQSMAAAQAVCSGRVTAMTCFPAPEGDAIFTRATVRAIDVLKGELPSKFDLVYPGGELGDTRMDDSGMPQLVVGDIRIFCLEAMEDGLFSPCQGRVGVWPVEVEGHPPLAAGGLPADGLIVPNRRHINVDRGEPIGVVLDLSTRPAGISEAQALTALANALAAWEAQGYVTFEFRGTETFPQSANTINDRSRLIRVQLHDNWNQISDTGTTLATGGSYSSPVSATGGEFDGRSFLSVSTSYIIVNHPKTVLSNPVSLEETLAHEIGHTLGLEHSSETDPEPSPLLGQALMYYIAHIDGRGADLRSWDIDAFHRAYPIDNRPPYSFSRYLTAVTAPLGALANPEVNIMHLVVDDFDGDAVSIDIVNDVAGNGTWSLNGLALTFTPGGWFPDADVTDPLFDSFDRFKYRVYDGSHYSAIREVSVVAFRSDTRPSGAPDGLPDFWMVAHFGSVDAVAGTSTATDDVDNDRLTTLEEFVLGSDPNSADSGIDAVTINTGAAHIEWDAFPYSVYELQESLDGGATWNNIDYFQSLDPTSVPRTNDVPTTSTALYRIRTRH